MDLRKIDLNLLVIFEAVYSAGNVSKAAKSLNLTQPTISNALNRLRDTLDDPLFTRKGPGVIPTQRATSMIGPVRDALRAIQNSVAPQAGFDPATANRSFRIVLLDLLEPLLMPPVLRVIQNHRTIQIEVLPVMDHPVAQALNDGSVDLLLTTFDPHLEGIGCEQVGTAQMVVAARKGHPKINGEITAQLLAEIGHVALIPKLRAMSRVDEALEFAQIRRHIVYTVTKFWSFPHVLATTDLIAMLPGDFARQAARFYPLDIFPPPFDFPDQHFYMIWKDGLKQDPGLLWLRDQISAAYRAGNPET